MDASWHRRSGLPCSLAQAPIHPGTSCSSPTRTSIRHVYPTVLFSTPPLPIHLNLSNTVSARHPGVHPRRHRHHRNLPHTRRTPEGTTSCFLLLPTSYFLLPTSYFVLLPTSYCLLTTYYLLLSTYYLLLTTYYFSTFYFLLPTSYFLLPTSLRTAAYSTTSTLAAGYPAPPRPSSSVLLTVDPTLH